MPVMPIEFIAAERRGIWGAAHADRVVIATVGAGRHAGANGFLRHDFSSLRLYALKYITRQVCLP
jgi:hypothetical protein